MTAGNRRGENEAAMFTIVGDSTAFFSARLFPSQSNHRSRLIENCWASGKEKTIKTLLSKGGTVIWRLNMRLSVRSAASPRSASSHTK